MSRHVVNDFHCLIIYGNIGIESPFRVAFASRDFGLCLVRSHRFIAHCDVGTKGYRELYDHAHQDRQRPSSGIRHQGWRRLDGSENAGVALAG